ncbi:hypothetical protein [Amycolatopsis samaneae]|uniref:Glycosyltransferase RgtA/B/C/D-like domain-containing protein n=1 Tax=Amycolatopsis samaneae TaxID=664691 RepID=A0ABW5GH70_9PSEU
MVYAVVGAWLLLAVLVVTTWGRIATDRRWRTIVLVLVLAFSLAHQLLFATITEDAYIAFRYAGNIADGNGPVFNAGERVEGYANFLWLVLISLPKAAFGVGVEGAAVALGVVAALGSVLLTYFLVNRIAGLALPEGAEPRPALGIAAAMLTAGASGLAVYGPSGGEMPLFVLLLLSLCYALAARRPVVAGVLVAFAVMTRPDGLVAALLAGLWLVFAAARGRHSWWAPAGYALGALVFLAPWTAWRVTYYHHLLPTAVDARLSGTFGTRVAEGWHYLSDFSLVHQGFLLLALVAAVALLLRRGGPDREARSVIWLLFAVAAGLAVFAVLLGGDGSLSWRQLAPLPPLLAVASVSAYGVLTAVATAKPSPRPRAWPAGTRLVPVAAAGLAGIAVLVSMFSPEVLDRVREWQTRSAQLAEIGDWLADYLPPGSVISASSPGALSYRMGAQLLVVDVLGQTDDHIAREGRRERGVVTDYDYVVNLRRPTVAVPTGTGYTDGQRCGIDPVYAGKYQVATFQREGTSSWVAVYPRTEQAQTVVDDLDRSPEFRHVPCPS